MSGEKRSLLRRMFRRGKDPRSGGVVVEAGGEDFRLVVKNPATIMKQAPVVWHPQYGLHVGWSALLLVLAIAGLGAVAYVSQLNLLFWSASVSAAILFLSIVLPGRMIHPLRVSKVLPDNGMVAQPMAIKIEVHNTRRCFGVYSLRVFEIFGKGQVLDQPRVYVPFIRPGQTCAFQVLITPVRRGQLQIRGTRLASRYPFGLMTRFHTELDGRKVTIYPALGHIDERFLPGYRRLDAHMSVTQSQYRGTSDEFYALREYRRGDNPRHIHWKRSARMRQLLVREMTQFSPHRLTVVLDTYAPRATAGTRLMFEEAVSFAATLLCESLEVGFRVALICAGDPPVLIPPVMGRESQHRILRTLSAVELQTRSPLPELVKTWRWMPRWRGRCLLVAMTPEALTLLDRFSLMVGPTQTLLVGSGEWRRTFTPPACLRSAEGGS